MICPECNGSRINKDGLRYTNEGQIQRFLCRDCGFRFSNNPYKDCQTNRNHQLCVLEAKKLDSQTKKKTVAGEKDYELKTTVKSKVFEHLWWLKQEGYSEETIKGRTQILKQLAKENVNLTKPDEFRNYLAGKKIKPGRRANIIYAYALFAKWLKIPFTVPRIRIPEKLPWIPIEREIDDLIAASTKHIATFFQLCKDTGGRSGEIWKLRWIDIDFQNNSVRIEPEKGSRPRVSKLTNRAIQLLNQLSRKNNVIFNGQYKNLRNLRRSFQRQRQRITAKLGNPRLMQIHLHTLRHWKGTEEYRKTKDIIYVMQVLGHRRIQNTLKYIQLAKIRESDDFICKVSKDDKEICALIEAGFEYVCDREGLKFFRKPK